MMQTLGKVTAGIIFLLTGFVLGAYFGVAGFNRGEPFLLLIGGTATIAATLAAAKAVR